MRRALSFAAAAAGLLACRSPTEIRVVVSTDAKCIDFKGAGMAIGELGTALESADLSSTSFSCDATGHVGSVVVVPSGADDAMVAIKIVAGVQTPLDGCTAANGFANCIVARRALHYIPHETLTLDVPLTLDCRNVACDSTSTCVAGECRPATIADPGACANATCEPGDLPPGEGGSADAGVADATVGDATIDAPVDAPFEGGDGSVVVTQGTGCSFGDCTLSTGALFTCATKNGGVACWGQNFLGELGQPPYNGAVLPGSVQTVSGALSGVRGIISNGDATCSFLNDGGTACFGAGALFGPQVSGDLQTATSLAEMAGAKAIAIGNNHACWLGQSGVECTDDKGQGARAHDVDGGSGGPVADSLPTPMSELVAGYEFTCSLSASGVITCEGGNDANECDPTRVSPPGPIPPTMVTTLPAKPMELALGEDMACARLLGGRVFCWGDDFFGTCGYDPAASQPPNATEVLLADGGSLGAAQLSLTNFTACAVQTNGHVLCWGDDAQGQVGTSATTSKVSTATPILDADGGAFTASFVSAGGAHVCARKSDDSVWCWGSNSNGQLGFSPDAGAKSLVPLRVSF